MSGIYLGGKEFTGDFNAAGFRANEDANRLLAERRKRLEIVTANEASPSLAQTPLADSNAISAAGEAAARPRFVGLATATPQTPPPVSIAKPPVKPFDQRPDVVQNAVAGARGENPFSDRLAQFGQYVQERIKALDSSGFGGGAVPPPAPVSAPPRSAYQAGVDRVIAGDAAIRDRSAAARDAMGSGLFDKTSRDTRSVRAREGVAGLALDAERKQTEDARMRQKSYMADAPVRAAQVDRQGRIDEEKLRGENDIAKAKEEGASKERISQMERDNARTLKKMELDAQRDIENLPARKGSGLATDPALTASREMDTERGRVGLQVDLRGSITGARTAHKTAKKAYNEVVKEASDGWGTSTRSEADWSPEAKAKVEAARADMDAAQSDLDYYTGLTNTPEKSARKNVEKMRGLAEGQDGGAVAPVMQTRTLKDGTVVKVRSLGNGQWETVE